MLLVCCASLLRVKVSFPDFSLWIIQALNKVKIEVLLDR